MGIGERRRTWNIRGEGGLGYLKYCSHKSGWGRVARDGGSSSCGGGRGSGTGAFCFIRVGLIVLHYERNGRVESYRRSRQ